MRTRATIGILVTIMLAFGAYQWLDAPAPTETLDDDGVPELITGPVLRGAPAEREADAAPTEPVEKTLRVKVVDERGVPLSDIPVAVASRRAHRGHPGVAGLLRTPDAFVVLQTADTDDNGLTSFEGLPKDHMFELRATPRAPHARTSQLRRWVADEPAVLVVRRGVPLRIRVVDIHGAGRRAWVAARPGREDAGERFADHRTHAAPTWILAEQATDADGRLDLGVVPARPLRFSVFVPGRGMRSGIVVHPGSQEEVELHLEEAPGSTIFGTVVDESGAAVPEALVVAASSPNPYSQYGTPAGELRIFDQSASSSHVTPCTALIARTDPRGAYRITGLPGGALTTLEVRHPFDTVLRHPFETTQLGKGQTLRADFRLQARGWVRGDVQDERGEPIADAEVFAWRSGMRRTTRTDADGKFAMQVPAGWVSVAARTAELFDTKGTRVNVSANEPVEVALRYTPAVPIEGEVRNADDDTLVAGAKIRVHVPNEMPRPAPVTTDAQGRFSFARLPPYHLSINASLGDRFAWASFVGGVARPPLVMRMQSRSSQAELEVEVADATPDRVHLVRAKGPSSSTLATRADNRVVFERFKPGTYKVYVVDAFERAAGEIVEVELSKAQRTWTQLPPPPLHALTGLVRDTAGHPVADRSVSVRLTAWEAGGINWQGRDAQRDSYTRTDASGRFRLDRLPVGDYIVRAAFGDAQRIRIPAKPVALRVPLPRKVAGTVLGPSGVAVASGRLALSQGDDGGNPDHQPAVDLELSVVEGRFEGVLPSAANFAVTVRAAHGTDGAPLPFVENEERAYGIDDTISIRLEALPEGRIAGYVLDANDAPVAGVSITCKPVEGRKRHHARTGTNGAFAFPNLYEGEYEIRATPVRGGPHVPPAPLRLATGTEDVSIKLQEGIELRGTARFRDGTPLVRQEVHAAYRVHRDTHRVSTKTDATGAFVLRGLPAGVRGTLRVGPRSRKPKGYLAWHKTGIAFDKHPRGYDPRIDRAHDIRGRVDGIVQEDARRARVLAQQRRRYKRKLRWITVATGAVRGDGTFYVGPMRAGRYRLVVQPPAGFKAVAPVEAQAGARDVVLSVRGAGETPALHRVLGEVDGPTNCTVYWIPDDDSGAFELELDPSGTFSLETKAATGTVFIRNEHKNLIAWQPDVRAGDRVHRFELRAGGVVAGMIPEAAGRPARGAVSLEIATGLDISARIESDATFRVVGVPPGSFAVEGYVQVKEEGKKSRYYRFRKISDVSAGRTNLSLELVPR